jgi:hypothetical protein
MIYIFGDSHSDFNFRNLPANNYAEPSITMHRIGRDNIIMNFKPIFNKKDSTFIFNYGEVDCRCNIGKQIISGRNLNDVCQLLVDDYFNTIKNNVKLYKNIIIVAIIPPTRKEDYESVNGPITHEYPFVGSDDDRLIYHETMNSLLKDKCVENGFIFFDPFDHYSDNGGFLLQSLSDNQVHIGNNGKFLEEFKKQIFV